MMRIFADFRPAMAVATLALAGLAAQSAQAQSFGRQVVVEQPVFVASPREVLVPTTRVYRAVAPRRVVVAEPVRTVFQPSRVVVSEPVAPVFSERVVVPTTIVERRVVVEPTRVLVPRRRGLFGRDRGFRYAF